MPDSEKKRLRLELVLMASPSSLDFIKTAGADSVRGSYMTSRSHNKLVS